MAKAKIKKDKHSLYLKMYGGIFRPVQTKEAISMGLSPSSAPFSDGTYAASAETTQFREFDLVLVEDDDLPDLIVVRSKHGNLAEYWYFHGDTDGDNLQPVESADVWQPVAGDILLQRRLFRHMVALRIKELDTAAALAKSLTVELSGQFLEKADALASTTPDAYAISQEVIDSYLKQLGEGNE